MKRRQKEELLQSKDVVIRLSKSSLERSIAKQTDATINESERLATSSRNLAYGYF